MFRVRARIDPALLLEYIEYVKTGLPGMAMCGSTRRSGGPARANVVEMSDPVASVSGLVLRHGAVTALDNVTLDIPSDAWSG